MDALTALLDTEIAAIVTHMQERILWRCAINLSVDEQRTLVAALRRPAGEDVQATAEKLRFMATRCVRFAHVAADRGMGKTFMLDCETTMRQAAESLEHLASTTNDPALTALRELVAAHDQMESCLTPSHLGYERLIAAWAAARAVLNDAGVAKEVDTPSLTELQNDPGWLELNDNRPTINYGAGGARPLVLNSGEAMPQGQNAAETTPGALPASPLSAATSLANAEHVDGPSQEGAGGSAATPSLDDLVARLRSSASPLADPDLPDNAADALIELRHERDDIFNAYEKFWLTDEGMLHAEIGSLAAHVQQAEARASALHDDAERYRWIRSRGQVGIDFADTRLKLKLGVEPNAIPSQFDAAIDAARRLAKPVEPT